MTSYEKQSMEDKINHLWWMIDHEHSEERITALVNKVRGIKTALDVLGYCVIINDDGNRKIVTHKQWAKSLTPMIH